MESGCIGVSPIISNHDTVCPLNLHAEISVAGPARPFKLRTAKATSKGKTHPSGVWIRGAPEKVERSGACKRQCSEDTPMATAVGRVTIWSIVALIAIVVIALIVVNR
jgi:hypothetical protein